MRQEFRDISQYRLINQQIAAPHCMEPAQVVAAFGAMQAQDYLGALWAIGLRLPDATEGTVENALAERKILRTWLMRGTLHFVAAPDVRWMLKLLAPRIIERSAYRNQQLELTPDIFVRSRKLFIRVLEGNRQRTRDEMMQLLERARISTAGQRGYHILWRLAQEGLLCFGARSGKQHTFALLEEWTPKGRDLEREAALAELAGRYFVSHGPATLPDFVWWTGLKASEAKAARDSISSQLLQYVVDGKVYWMSREVPSQPHQPRSAYLLPSFDEYLVGYSDRSAVLNPQFAPKVASGGMLVPAIVIGGHVVGMWRRSLEKKEVAMMALPFMPLKKTEEKAFVKAALRYGKFLGRAVKFEIVRSA